jgi:hypothetical protein
VHIRIRDLRLHAASGAHFRIPDAKTEAGIREVQVSPDLLEEIVAHVDRLRRAGLPTEPESHLFPNLRGGRMKRQRANEIVREAATLASTRLAPRYPWNPLVARGLRTWRARHVLFASSTRRHAQTAALTGERA